jgi:hypothetical protein
LNGNEVNRAPRIAVQRLPTRERNSGWDVKDGASLVLVVARKASRRKINASTGYEDYSFPFSFPVVQVSTATLQRNQFFAHQPKDLAS